jgi:hypothetical protein
VVGSGSSTCRWSRRCARITSDLTCNDNRSLGRGQGMAKRIVSYLRLVTLHGRRVADPPKKVHPTMTPEAKAARAKRIANRKHR